MNKKPSLNRRRFLGAAAATAGYMLSTGMSQLRAAVTRETDHFWCRLAPEGPYINSQRDHRAFGFADGKIFLSEDKSQSWAHSWPIPQAWRKRAELDQRPTGGTAGGSSSNWAALQ